jgi:hypothetical protein
MKRQVICLLPDGDGWHDYAVSCAGEWLKIMLTYAMEKDFSVLPAIGMMVRRATVESILSQTPNSFLFGVGHGNATVYTGWKTEVVLQKLINEEKLAGHPWYALSCIVGADLGKAVVAAGCPAFCGWDETFTWIADSTKPDGGAPAQGFKEAVNAFLKDLIDGGDYDSAYIASQAKFEEWYEKEPSDEVKKWLLWDMTHQVAPRTSSEYGSGNTNLLTDEGEDEEHDEHDVVIHLERKPYLLSVYCLDKAENPLDGVEVELYGYGTKLTDALGCCSFGNIPPGEYDLKASKAHYKSVVRHIILE